MTHTYIPEDLMKEIISYLPPKVAGRARILSKPLSSLIINNKFGVLHYKNHLKIKKFVALTHDGQLFGLVNDNNIFDRSKISLDRRFNSVGNTCDGMCILTDGQNNIYILNPLLNKMVTIKPPNVALPPGDSYRDYGFFKEDRSEDYKVLVMSTWSIAARNKAGYSDGIVVDIYSTATEVWKRCLRHEFLNSPLFFHLSAVIGGGVYFVKTIRNGRMRKSRLMVYDVEEDAVSEIQILRNLTEAHLWHCLLLAIDGCICLLSGQGNQRVLWILQNNSQNFNSWIKLPLVNLECRYWADPISFLSPRLLLLINDQDHLSTYNLDAPLGEAMTLADQALTHYRLGYVLSYFELEYKPYMCLDLFGKNGFNINAFWLLF